MAKRVVPFVVSSKELVKHLRSTMISSNQVCFSNAHAHVHTQSKEEMVKAEVVVESVGEVGKGGVETASAWDAAKKSAQTVIETTTAEADTNVVDTAEYRSAEDLNGQLGDGCDNNVHF